MRTFSTSPFVFRELQGSFGSAFFLHIVAQTQICHIRAVCFGPAPSDPPVSVSRAPIWLRALVQFRAAGTSWVSVVCHRCTVLHAGGTEWRQHPQPSGGARMSALSAMLGFSCWVQMHFILSAIEKVCWEQRLNWISLVSFQRWLE